MTSPTRLLGPGRPGAAALAGRFVLVDLLGAGGMGSVWRGWDLRERRWTAVKVLGRYDATLLQRFVHEQGVRVEHPHVAAPTGWLADDERVAFTTDLVHGGTVLDLLADHRRLPEPLVAELLDQLLQGLVAVHRAGVVHRDVKPANLLLEATGVGRPHLRIGDFGVATTLDGPRFTLAAGTVGTPGYADPDQRRGAAPDPRHDLWSVGVVGVQLLTGVPPSAHPGPPPPGALHDVLGALLAPDPAQRPATAAQALALLRAAGVTWRETGVRVPDRLPHVDVPRPGRPRRAPRAGREHPTRRPHRRHRAPVGVGPEVVASWAGLTCLAASMALSAAATWRALGT